MISPQSERRLPLPESPGVLALAGILLLAVGLAAAALFTSRFGSTMLPSPLSKSKETHPPCDQLPTRAEAQKAIDEHPEYIGRIKAVSPTVTVRADSPGCEDPNRALVIITYANDDDLPRLEEVLVQNTGIGSPLYLQKGS